jgi:DNA polymerase-1
VKEFLDKSVDAAKKAGYASTLFNRRRPIPELKSPNFNLRSFGERVAMNMPIQGTAADIIKIAMIKVHNRLKSEGLKSRLVLQVHDELLLEARRDEIESVKALLREEMESAASLRVVLEADIHEGETWYDSK